MGFRRSFGWAATGAAATAAMLVASPGTYAWLRRVTGRESGRDYYETSSSTMVDDDQPETDAEELRLSLRARLADEPTDEFAVIDEDVASDPAGADDAVAQARERVRAKARAARERIATPENPET